MSTDATDDKPDDTPEDLEAAPAEEAPAEGEGEGLAEGLTIGQEAPPEEPAVRLPSRLRGRQLPDGTVVATGRRKTAVARVRLKKGNGQSVVNDRPLEDFFRIERDRMMIAAPLQACNLEGQYDLWVRVAGGGISGQAGAIVLGIARCLQTIQPELHGTLSDGGFLTRDDRMVERKKYGHRKARRSFQFSKR
jgi:small subunit ribosomal protein S9